MPPARFVPIALAATALAGAAASPAAATQVAYVDGGQVWVSTLDGAKKRSLSGPSPDEKQWSEVAQGDDGSILGVRRESGKIGTLNATRLWGPDGTLRGEGSLTAPSGRTSYAYPVTLDLTPDAKVVVYGYANWSGFGTSTTYEFGTYVEGSSAWYATPFDLGAVRGGTLVDRRIVGYNGATVVTQNAGSAVPYSNDFTPWFVGAGAGENITRVDVAANGKLAAVETYPSGSGSGGDKVAMVPFASLGAPPPTDGSDCYLPTQGDPSYVSISQDGTRMAWHDDRGVVVAGTPVWFPSAAVSTCNLSSPPVVISASGKMPSLGPSTVATPPTGPGPGDPGPGGPGPGNPGGDAPGGGGPGGSPGGAAPKVTLAKTVRAAALKAGLALKVTVANAGPVTATAKVGRKTVASGKATAKRAGAIKLTLKASRAYRTRLRSLRRKTLAITVKAGGRATVVKRKLR
ncbi:hypothetical protein [Patulibacter defluvii]|uniref:hypothetical protein n=1 Tax=Patulibacter defluvii TaxID=3095358 RepID=UPI002A75070A|nr:hypothetical protein [Patulibacter sp. DM4]